MRRSSIQRRVLVGSVIAVAGTIGATGLAIHRAAEIHLRANGRDALRTVVEVGAHRVAADSVFAVRVDNEERGEVRGATRPGLYWIVRPVTENDLLARSNGFPAIEIDGGDLIDADLGAGEHTAASVWETVGEDGLAYRVASLVLELGRPDNGGARRRGLGPPWMEAEWGMDDRNRRPGPPRGGDGPRRGPGMRPFEPGEQFAVAVATPIQSEVDSLKGLSLLLGAAGLAAMLVAALSIRIVVRRGLAPLDALSEQIAAIRETDLDDVIEVQDAPTELVPIVSAFDATRARLAQAFDREKRFTADAAHELRTPIAGLRATLEVALRRERSAAEHRDAAAQCLAIALSMQETVESLLLLARSGTEAAARVPVDIEAAMRRAFATVAEPLTRRGLTVTYRTRSEGSGLATVIPGLFDRIATNLASNAASYAVEGTAIGVNVSASDGHLELSVSNTCAPLPANANEKAFEPFWRADAARTGEDDHTGLGLTLVRTCAETMDGEVAVETDGGRFTVIVTLPRGRPTNATRS